MSEERGKLQRQIEELQARLAEAEATLKAVDNRVSLLGRRPQIRIAQTREESESEGSYPGEDSGANTFGIVFRDPTFAEAVGPEPLGGAFLSDKIQRYARTIPSSYIPKNRDVFAVEVDGKHYIIGRVGKPNEEEDEENGEEVKEKCICNLIDILEEEKAISKDAADRARKDCDCPVEEEEEDVVPCDTCDDEKMPAIIQLELDGITDELVSVTGALVNAAVTDSGEYTSTADWFNRTFSLFMDGCAGSDAEDFPCPVFGGAPAFLKYRLGVRLSHAITGWQVRLSVFTIDITGSSTDYVGLTAAGALPTPGADCFTEVVEVGNAGLTTPTGPAIDGTTLDYIRIVPSSRILAPPPEHPYAPSYSCSSVSNGIMNRVSLSISGLTDTADQPQYDGWANAINGTWDLLHINRGANGYASICEPAIFIEVPDNRWVNPTYASGSVAIKFLPADSEHLTLTLRFYDNTKRNDRSLVFEHNPSNAFPRDSFNKPISSSTYSDWTVKVSPDAGLTAWLSNATITLNP